MSANSKLGEQLISLNRREFTGILTIRSQDEKQWEMSFYRGKYLWTEGGSHVNRSLQRTLTFYCPEVDTSLLVLRHHSEIRSLNYHLVTVLLQRRVIKREKVKAVMETLCQETFFDLLQKEYHNSLEYDTQNTSAHYLLKVGFSLSLDFINLEQMLFQAQTNWSAWGSKGLASCSPHHAPLLKQYQELKQQVPDIILTNMSRLLNGKRTLRDLAIKMDKNVLDLTCGLIPYFFKGYLRLLEISDLPELYQTAQVER